MNNYIMKKLPNRKVLLLLLVLTACFVSPVRAQYSDGFFRNNELYNDRDGVLGGYNIGTQIFGSDVYGGYNITTQVFGQEAPLGGGLVVLAITGVTYAIKKRKNNNKK